jgi:hypothetical protein
LTPWADYHVRALFWDATGTVENWNIRAGFDSDPGGNTLYSAADAAGLLGATAAPLASSLDYRSDPLFAEANRELLAASLGVRMANADGEIEVYIDDMPSSIGANRRTLYDGLGVSQIGPLTMSVSGDFTIGAGATLEIDILTSSIVDRLDVGGQFTAGGVLDIALVTGAPTPQPGDYFDIIDAASFAGTFDSIGADTLGEGDVWDARELYTTGAISVLAAGDALYESAACFSGPDNTTPGACESQDHNLDGDVDMHDFAKWQACAANPSGVLVDDCLAD